MYRRSVQILLAIGTACGLMLACDESKLDTETPTPVQPTSSGPGDVTTARLEAEADRGDNWLVRGGRLTGEHFSPLDQIDSQNVESLGLAWAVDVPSSIGLVAEPIVVDGVAYISAPLSVVLAFDAATGELIWRFDPEIDFTASLGASLSARWNRGVAVWKGKVIVGTGDCRLIAIDAARGTLIWDVPACDATNGVEAGGGGAGITAAPLVADDKVFIGYLGSDSGARGSVAAFDVSTGKELWRFWTVPGDPDGPEGGLETAALRRASETWTGGWAAAGGGAVWDSIHYDPVTGYVIVGTASGMPLSTKERGPGDNLYTNSVLALDADTGTYQWHYQTVPEDGWDFDAVMPKIVTEIELDGKRRRVVFEAGKSGFFYVLDAYTGDLLAADAIAKVTWASHIDLETGRPVRLPAAQYWDRDPADTAVTVFPNVYGARNWEAMAYNPETGLVYMPIADLGTPWCPDGPAGSCTETNVLGLTAEDEIPPQRGRLLAWDPVKREERWSAPHRLPFNGGVLTTAGDLVFQGTGTGELEAHHAQTGETLWSRPTGSSIQAAPVTYRVGDEQYVLVTAGTGGGLRVIHPEHLTTPDARGPSRLIAFKLNGAPQVPITPVTKPRIPKPPKLTASIEQIAHGSLVYGICGVCHGDHVVAISKITRNGAMPDLRYSPYLQTASAWKEVVYDGSLADKGMPAVVKDMGLGVDDAEAVRAYVIQQAWKAYDKQSSSQSE